MRYLRNNFLIFFEKYWKRLIRIFRKSRRTCVKNIQQTIWARRKYILEILKCLLHKDETSRNITWVLDRCYMNKCMFKCCQIKKYICEPFRVYMVNVFHLVRIKTGFRYDLSSFFPSPSSFSLPPASSHRHPHHTWNTVVDVRDVDLLYHINNNV